MPRVSRHTEYTCTQEGCSSTFPRNSDRIRHERQHLPYHLRPFPCEEPNCRFRANQKSGLTCHFKSIHTLERVHCQIPNCEKSFSDPGTLSRHMRKYHQKESDGPLAGKRKTVRSTANDLAGLSSWYNELVGTTRPLRKLETGELDTSSGRVQPHSMVAPVGHPFDFVNTFNAASSTSGPTTLGYGFDSLPSGPSSLSNPPLAMFLSSGDFSPELPTHPPDIAFLNAMNASSKEHALPSGTIPSVTENPMLSSVGPDPYLADNNNTSCISSQISSKVEEWWDFAVPALNFGYAPFNCNNFGLSFF